MTKKKNQKTMIQLSKETVAKLQGIKKYPRQTYDEVINDLIDNNEVEYFTDEDIKEINEGLEDIKAGRTISLEDLKKKYGL